MNVLIGLLLLVSKISFVNSQVEPLQGNHLPDSVAPKKQSFKASRAFSHAKSSFAEFLSEESEVVSTMATPVIQIEQVQVDAKTADILKRLKDTDKFGNLESAVVIKDQYGNTVSEGNKIKVVLDNEYTGEDKEEDKENADFGKSKSIVASVKDLLNSDEMKLDYGIVTDADPEENVAPVRKAKNERRVSVEFKYSKSRTKVTDSPKSPKTIETSSKSYDEKTYVPAVSPAVSMPVQPNRYVDVKDLTKVDLVWISTIEGLTAHFDMMKRFWAYATAHNRNLVVASYKSAHYPGVKSVDICAHFNLPVNVQCTNVRRNVIVNLLNCTLAPQEHG
jgi:hypothetical protein